MIMEIMFLFNSKFGAAALLRVSSEKLTVITADNKAEDKEWLVVRV